MAMREILRGIGMGLGDNPNASPNAQPYPNQRQPSLDVPQVAIVDPEQQSRGSFTTDASQSDRVGRFPDLSMFAVCEGQDINMHGSELEEARLADLGPGCIIRIGEVDQAQKNSRLHDRIMLVIRMNRSGSSDSLMCLAFRRRAQRRSQSVPRPDLADDYARVICVRATDVGLDDNITSLKVNLGVGGTDFTPQPEVWLNIREIWNVDLQVSVAVLGEAEGQSFDQFLKDFSKLFVKSLGVSWPDEEVGEPVAQARPAPARVDAERRAPEARAEPIRSSTTQRQSHRPRTADKEAVPKQRVRKKGSFNILGFPKH